ncbi:hypothetical protein AALB16_01080 [Lachnospiraceae bacterium 62-35]
MSKSQEYCNCCRNNCPIDDLQCRKGKEKREERLRKALEREQIVDAKQKND